MAHDVTVKLPKQKLAGSEVEFQIKHDGEKFGTMTVSKGSVVWFPKGVASGYKLKWKKFDELMQAEAKQKNH